MTAWPSKPIGNLCNLINGRAFKPSDWGVSGLPIVRIQNLNDHSKPFNLYKGKFVEKHLIDNDAILLSWSGTPGTSFGCFRWMRGPAILNQHIFKVIVNEEIIDGDFFIYAVNSKLEEMIRQSHGGVGLQHITKSKLEAIRLPVPQLVVQRRIVARIKECLERIEEIESLRATTTQEHDFLLESLIEAEFQQVDGEPVSLSEVCSITSILVDPRKGAYLDLPHVGGANIESKTGWLLDIKTSRGEKLKSSKFVFDETMVLYNKIRPYLMKVARPDFKGLCSADMYPLAPNQDRLTRDYLFYLLLSRNFTQYAIGGSNRAGMPKVNREHLFAYNFILPPVEQQVRLTQVMDSAASAIGELCSDMRASALESSALRQSILRKAFAGEL
ncbi:MAG: restriction endonuclease subunit S [Nitrospirae bacterium]|nr:restriction endonuclease subunit S [Nitrospirota bacterium]